MATENKVTDVFSTDVVSKTNQTHHLKKKKKEREMLTDGSAGLHFIFLAFILNFIKSKFSELFSQKP